MDLVEIVEIPDHPWFVEQISLNEQRREYQKPKDYQSDINRYEEKVEEN